MQPNPLLFSPANMDPNDPLTWSSVIYRTSDRVSQAAVARLLSAMKHRYGQSAKVDVRYYLDARQRRALIFCCGEVHNAAQASALRQFTDSLVRRLTVTCTAV